MKKILTICMCMISVLLITGCGNKIKPVEGKLEDLMTKVYDGVNEEELPMMLGNIELTKKNKESYIGKSKFEYKEALASESGIGSFAHSVVLIRMPDKVTQKEMDAAVAELKKEVNPRKWICVEVKEVQVETNGNLILVVLNDDIGDTLIENFKKIK